MAFFIRKGRRKRKRAAHLFLSCLKHPHFLSLINPISAVALCVLHLSSTVQCQISLPVLAVPPSFSLRCNYSQFSVLSSSYTTHLSRVMRQLRFSSAHPWVNSNMAYWLTPECAHKAQTQIKVFCAHLSHKKTGRGSKQGARGRQGRQRESRRKSWKKTVREHREDKHRNTHTHKPHSYNMEDVLHSFLVLLLLLSLWWRHTVCMCVCLRQNQWANEGSIMPLTHSPVP